MALQLIQYPYLPAGREYKYVSAENEFMAVAKKNMESQGCRKHATSAVAVKDGKIVASGSNAAVFVTICPRVYKGYGTGEGYRYCSDYCGQNGHAEVMLVRDAQSRGVDLTGADVYLYGHWWACQKCWDHLIAAGIRDLYVADGSQITFNDKARNPGEHEAVDLKLYVSGPLTHANDESLKAFYEGIAKVAESFGFETHVPHLHTDPTNTDITAEHVYAFDSSHVKESDVVVCYVGEPSLGVGMEIEMAQKYKALVVLLSEKGTKVSRLVLGSPAVVDHIEFDTRADAFAQLTSVFGKLVKAAKKKNQSTL